MIGYPVKETDTYSAKKYPTTEDTFLASKKSFITRLNWILGTTVGAGVVEPVELAEVTPIGTEFNGEVAF